MNNDFMLDVIQSDFNVKLLMQKEDARIFYGFKNGYVHFVKEYGNYIVQQHIPRFEFARCFMILFRNKIENNQKSPADKFNSKFMVAKYSEELYSIIFGKHTFQLSLYEADEFFNEIKIDVQKYQKAQKTIKLFDEILCLETPLTVNGNYFISKDRNIDHLTAIAFENQIFKNLSTKPPVSIYAMYSKVIDENYEITSEEFTELAQTYRYYNPDEMSDELKSVFLKIQKKFSFPDFNAGTDQIKKKMELIHNLLTPIQKAQFAEIYDLQRGTPFFMMLALITNIIDASEYIEMVSPGLQPDSEFEQKIRYETNIIVSFGKLFRNEVPNDSIKSVKIGSQIWADENLSVTEFQNGDTVPMIKTKSAWKKACNDCAPAWCYYDFKVSNGKKYGKLYNWYAVNDIRGLAPVGWHISSDEEWTILTNFLGGDDEAGKHLKSKVGWGDSDQSTNSSGFGALPAGIHGYNVFNLKGDSCFFWTSDGFGFNDGNTPNGIYRCINQEDDGIVKGGYFTNGFFSVRCIKD